MSIVKRFSVVGCTNGYDSKNNNSLNYVPKNKTFDQETYTNDKETISSKNPDQPIFIRYKKYKRKTNIGVEKYNGSLKWYKRTKNTKVLNRTDLDRMENKKQTLEDRREKRWV